MAKIIRITESKLVKLINNLINESKELSDKEIYNTLRKSIEDGEVTVDRILGNMMVTVELPYFFQDRDRRSRIIKFLISNGFKSEGEGRFVRYSHNTDKKLGMMESKVMKKLNESFWNSIFGKPTSKDAFDTHLKRHGYAGGGRTEERPEEFYTTFNGEKYYDEDIEYADPYDTGEIPRVENGKLIIANPAWRL